MNLDRAVLAVAGTVVLLSLVLTPAVSSWWLLLTAFVGLNPLQASFTGFGREPFSSAGSASRAAAR